MKRSAPYALFATLTLLVFWNFIFHGHSLYCVSLVEKHLGREPKSSSDFWFSSNHPRVRITDSVLLFPTHYRAYNEGLKKGELHLWNHTLFCGTPVYANPMVHPFYPPHLLLHALFPSRTAYGLSLMLHFLFSGICMYWVLIALGRTRWGATAGGIIWMLLGYQALWFSAAILIGVSVFGPLALLGIVRAQRHRSLAYGALGAVAMGMVILGSHPQHALLFFLFLLAWMAFAALIEILNKPESWRFALSLMTLFVIFSVGIGLAAILSRLDTLEHGYRRTGEDITVLYKHPLSLVGYTLGIIVGKALFPVDPLSIQFELPAYAGATATALAILGAVIALRTPAERRTAAFISSFALFTLLAAFLAPVAKILQFLPILNLSPPTRWIYIFGFCLTLLASRGFDALGNHPKPMAVALAAGTGLILLACLQKVGPFRLSNGAAIDTLLGFALAAMAVFVIILHRRTGLILVTAALFFELLTNFLLYNRQNDPSILDEKPEALAWVRERDPGPWRTTGGLRSDPADGGRLQIHVLVHSNNILSIFGAETIAGFDAIVPAHYATYAGLAAGAVITPTGRSIYFRSFDAPLLDLANVKYLFMPFAIKPPERFKLVREFPDLKLYENTTALPRAWVVGRAFPSPDEAAALERMRSPDFDPRREVVLITDDTMLSDDGPVEARVAFHRPGSDALRIGVETDRKSFLVVSETDYPGWEAAVNGKPAPLYRANVAFRAVALEPGSNVVEFTFRPASARTGIVGSLLFALLALGYVIKRAR